MPVQATISNNLTIMGSQLLSNLQDKGNGRGEFCLTWIKVSSLLTSEVN